MRWTLSTYLDFQEAFDKVSHEHMLAKVESFGITGCLLSWILNYLYDRKQRVCVRDSYSSWSSVTSGVPQGSVLGPILFIIYINDLPDVVLSSLWIFVDDTKVFRSISSGLDSEILQDDIDRLVEWSETWQA